LRSILRRQVVRRRIKLNSDPSSGVLWALQQHLCGKMTRRERFSVAAGLLKRNPDVSTEKIAASLTAVYGETFTVHAVRWARRALGITGRTRRLATVAHRMRSSERFPKDVREVKGGAMQSRPWIYIGRRRNANVNLGLFHPEEYGNDRDAAIGAAARASREFKKRLAVRGTDLWAVIRALQGERRFGLPVVPGHVLPPLVRRAPWGYEVKGRNEQFPTIEAAWTVAKRDFYGEYLPVERVEAA
jgi:hypothetical protein